MKLKDLLKEAVAEISYKKSGLQNPDKADLDHDKEISSWEKKRGTAIEKNLKKEFRSQVPNAPTIKYGNEERPMQTMPSPDSEEMMTMGGMCQECGAPMMFEDRMCSECGWMEDVEEQHEEPVRQEKDHEVFMAKASLQNIVSNASQLMNKLGDEEIDIPAWVQDHITNADNYISQANDGYYEYESGEGNETPDDIEDVLENEFNNLGKDKFGYTQNAQAAGPFRGAQGPMQMASGNLESKKK